MNPLERKLDARNGHVQFDERGVETECRAGYSGTGNRKGRSRLWPQPKHYSRHSSTLQITWGPAARDFGCGQGGEAGASPQRAVTAEPTRAADKRTAARRVFAQKAGWLRCSSVTAPLRGCSLVAPRHPAFSAKTGPHGIFRQALSGSVQWRCIRYGSGQASVFLHDFGPKPSRIHH
jgi:hypothetical protein